MSKLIIHQNKIDNIENTLEVCPFNALENIDGKITVNAACKMCSLCVKKGPIGAFEIVETDRPYIDKSSWEGIAVFIERSEGKIHPVSYELIGKAKEMAAKINHPVYCLLAGYDVKKYADEILEWGIDELYVYDQQELDNFKIEPYKSVFTDFINKTKPSSILVGATNIGRSLAPRVAATFKTGLTADCTVLDVQLNTDLDQIRPAFGGNIMAHIRTPDHRPQFATVRYKVFDPPKEKGKKNSAKLICCNIEERKLKSDIEILEIKQKEKTANIEDAPVIIAVGRAFKKKEDLNMVNELAKLLDAELGSSRPLIEEGIVDPIRQIGLSGRTVKPKLIITCGISGAIQFRAGMSNADTIFAINNDSNAPIFDVAHYGIVGDVYEIIPQLIEKIKNGRKIV
ncbi:MAG TPA: FAD-binding protein [Victivallales bacterium]|nr:FAD-binding protein [Victivallales bacterium]